MTKKPRPLGVTILGLWLVVLAFLSILSVLTRFFTLVWFILAVGVLYGEQWARDFTLVVTLASVLGSILLLSIGSYLFAAGPPIGALMIYYLTRPSVKAYFGQGSVAPESSKSTSPSDIPAR